MSLLVEGLVHPVVKEAVQGLVLPLCNRSCSVQMPRYRVARIDFIEFDIV